MIIINNNNTKNITIFVQDVHFNVMYIVINMYLVYYLKNKCEIKPGKLTIYDTGL